MKKYIVLLIILFVSYKGYSQRIKMEYATVNYYDKFRWNYTQTDVDAKTKQCTFSNINGKNYANLTFKKYGNETLCTAIFPEYKLKYEGYYPENTSLREVLLYWDEYNAVNDSVLDLNKLKVYCNSAVYRLKPVQ